MRTFGIVAIAALAFAASADASCKSDARRLVRSGVCRDFINYFREHIDELGDNPTDAEIKAALGKAPIPSDDCCYSVRPFIDAGCPCDAGVVSLAGRANIKASTLRTLSRAVPVSSCNDPKYGAGISDHCSASAFAQITAKIAEEAAEDAAEAQAYAEEAKKVADAEKAVAESEPKAEEAQTSTEEDTPANEEAPAEETTEAQATEEKQE